MAPTSKPREKRRRNCFFNSTCCFGSYQERDHDDGTLFKVSSGKKSSQRAENAPISDSKFVKVMNKDTHMVVQVEADDHKLLSSPDKIIVNKDMVTEKGTKAVAANDGSVRKEKMNAGADQFDPLVGALILITALIVMLVWGKVSAILCTATWFYLLPRFTRLNNNLNDSYGMRLGNGPDQTDDLGSMEYKKKVVFQGFLKRN